MIKLPKSTEFNKRIPKQKFYENIDISPKLKRVFIEQVKTIFWKNKIATSTTNLAKGSKVDEIQVFEIKLNSQLSSEDLLLQIDREIPYHIVFILEYEEKYQIWIGYKEEALSGNKAFKVDSYYHTEWINKEEINLTIEGLNLDTVYENFIRQIAGERLITKASDVTIKDSINRTAEAEALQKEINMLKAKMIKEKQLNKQMEINSKVKKLIKKLEEL